jgi:AraC-like DNA-binding protein
VRHYIARPPAAPLADHVAYVWASRGAPAHALERVVPTGTLELIVSVVDDGGQVYDPEGREQHLSGGAVVSGAYRRPFTFASCATTSVVGVHLRPGRAGEILGIPANELVDRHVDLDALWGARSVRELRERICEARTTERRFQILEATLAARLRDRRMHPSVAYALDVLAGDGARIAAIAKETGASQRRLIEHFTAAVGLTPKRFGRIMRFHRATALARTSTLEWARLAQECGYYDQAHLIREFRDLAEMTPTDVVRASTHVQEHHQLAVLDR